MKLEALLHLHAEFREAEAACKERLAELGFDPGIQDEVYTDLQDHMLGLEDQLCEVLLDSAETLLEVARHARDVARIYEAAGQGVKDGNFWSDGVQPLIAAAHRL